MTKNYKPDEGQKGKNMKTRKRILSVIMAVAMVASMMFAMTANTYAATDNVNANITLRLYYEGVSEPADFDSAVLDVAEGTTIYDVITSEFGYYDPEWTTGTDPYNGQTTKYLKTFKLGEEAKNVSYVYREDGSGWSIDWGWIYTVNDKMPSFPNEPNHGMAMNQYQIQENDDILVVFACVKSTWDAAGNTTYEILDPATVY